MTVTVAQIIRINALKLSLLSGSNGLNRLIRWVHVAEVEDPTPWLQGGEFLLTTGLMFKHISPREYVARLHASDVSALGFGVGIVYQEAPKELIEATEHMGLPLVSVPLETPYVTISETVSHLLTEQKVHDAQRVADSQKELVQALLRGGTEQVLSTAAALIGGWVVATDRHGNCDSSVPSHIVEQIRLLHSDLHRMSFGQIRTGSVIVHGETILIQPILQNELVWGFLIAGTATLDRAERSVLTSAVALLTLEASLEYRANRNEHERRRLPLRSLLLEKASLEYSEEQLRDWGFSSHRVRLAVLSGSQWHLKRASGRIIEHLASNQITSVAVGEVEPTFLTLMIDIEHFDDIKEFLINTFRGEDRVRLATGPTVELEHLLTSYLSLKRIVTESRRGNTRLSHADSVLSLEYVLRQATDHNSLISFCQSVLGPLFQVENGEPSKETLRVFLESGARWHEASKQLGIHRHTLRRRIEQLENVLGAKLDVPSTRMELWFALLVEDLLQQE